MAAPLQPQAGRQRAQRDWVASGGNRITKAVDVHTEASEHLASQSFDVEHAEQNVTGGHLWLLLLAREPTCPFESAPCPGRERQERCTVRQSSAGSHRFDHLVARSCERHAGPAQRVGRLTVIIGQHSEEQMLGANVWMIKLSRLRRGK